MELKSKAKDKAIKNGTAGAAYTARCLCEIGRLRHRILESRDKLRWLQSGYWIVVRAILLSVQCNAMHMHWTEYKIT